MAVWSYCWLMSLDDPENVDGGICAGDQSGAGRGEGYADLVGVSSQRRVRIAQLAVTEPDI